MSSPVVINTVIDAPVVNDKKIKKPRAPKTVATTEPVVAAENVSESLATEPNTVKDKKIKKPRAPKTVATEPVVALAEPAAELVAEPLATEPAVTTEKKKREPGLPAKYGKFLQFGYYLAEMLKDTEGNFTINSYDDFINKLNLFDTVDNQASFVQKFFDQSKDINKSIKKMVANKKKADAKAAKLAAKPPKKTSKKNSKNNTDNTDTDTDTVVDNDNFVSEVVSLANPNTKPKRKYNKKNTVVNTDNNATLNNNDVNDNDNDDALDVEIILIDGTNYLVDNNKRIFDFNNHNLIGSIDNNNLLVLH